MHRGFQFHKETEHRHQNKNAIEHSLTQRRWCYERR